MLPRRSKRARHAPVAKLSQAMKKAVHSLVNSSDKKKQMKFEYTSNEILVPAGTTGTISNIKGPINDYLQFNTFLPPVSQGVGINKRIGDRIKPISLRVKGLLSWQPNPGQEITGSPQYYSGSAEIEIRMMVISSRTVKSYDLLSQIDPATLLNAGSGPIPYDGSQCVSFYPINPLDFTVHHDKRIRLNKPIGVPPYDDNGEGHPTNYAGSMAANTQSNMCKPIDFTVKLPSHILYPSDSSNVASNFAPILVFGYTIPSSLGLGQNQNKNWAVFSYTSVLHYEDA